MSIASVRRVPPNEVGLTLVDEPPRTLGFLDLVALWGNLGISLLGPTAALRPPEPRCRCSRRSSRC
jgi:hypothetical protein